MILTLLVNVFYWPLVHILVSAFALRRRRESFDSESWAFRERRWERGGSAYRCLGVKRWKRWLPDGAAWMGQSFRKDEVARDRQQLRPFLLETCRAEWAHWLMLAAAPWPVLWNPLWASGLMLAYGVLFNLPCIVAQRYNRLSVRKILRRSLKAL